MIVGPRKIGLVLILSLLLSAASAAPATASPGDRDTTFGGNGKVNTNFTPGPDFASAVAIQPDGKIVAAGLEGLGRFGLARYKQDGSLDTSFGGDGRVTTSFTSRTDFAKAVVIQPDGKIVAAGFAGDKATFALARYERSGDLDTTFGGDGKVRTNLTFGQDVAYGVALQADGKIVAAGSGRESGDAEFGVARYDPDGTLDSTFGDNGREVINFTSGGDMAFAVPSSPTGGSSSPAERASGTAPEWPWPAFAR